jgi:hypothetical protein
MKLVLISLVAALFAGTVVAPMAGAAQAFRYDEELAIVARESLWRSVTPSIPRTHVDRVNVKCYRDRRTFETAFEARFGLSATRVIAYYAGGKDLHLRAATCADVHMFLAGRHTVYTAAAYSILLHEALHRQGIRNERLTTCLANDAVRWGALWVGFDETRALRARQLAMTFTRLFTPKEYRMGQPTCLAINRRTDWVDHRLPSR